MKLLKTYEEIINLSILGEAAQVLPIGMCSF